MEERNSMTFTLNGCGTNLSGSRYLNDEELSTWGSEIEDVYNISAEACKIATISNVFLWIPIIPLRTIVYYDVPREHWYSDDKYVILFYPGKFKLVYWKHVKSSMSFYILPFIIMCCLINWYIL